MLLPEYYALKALGCLPHLPPPPPLGLSTGWCPTDEAIPPLPAEPPPPALPRSPSHSSSTPGPPQPPIATAPAVSPDRQREGVVQASPTWSGKLAKSGSVVCSVHCLEGPRSDCGGANGTPPPPSMYIAFTLSLAPSFAPEYVVHFTAFSLQPSHEPAPHLPPPLCSHPSAHESNPGGIDPVGGRNIEILHCRQQKIIHLSFLTLLTCLGGLTGATHKCLNTSST